MRRLIAKLGLISACFLVLSSGPARAYHDTTTLIGLRVTVTSVSGNDVTIQVAGQGVGSSSLPSARLGSQFFLNGASTLDRWVSAGLPAIDWGDGSVIQNTGISFTNTTGSTGPSPFATTRFFSGQFVHSYAAVGDYTIRVFGTDAFAYSAIISSGNPVSATNPLIEYSGNTTATTVFFTVTGMGPVGVSNTAVASVASTDSEIDYTCGLVGIELLFVLPFLARRRKKS